MAAFKAIRIDKGEQGQTVGLVDFDENDLMDGDVTVAVEWSTVNYKDGLALTGKAPVVRRFPMIPGIDFAGTVESSTHSEWKPGDKVILNGWGTGETHLGAYGEKARVKGDWLVPLPAGMSGRDAMAVGTAGYTAMLAVMALERHGVTPGKGRIVVTGAAGGVGSVAIALLSKLGFTVIASTGRPQEADYLKQLGATRRTLFRTGGWDRHQQCRLPPPGHPGALSDSGLGREMHVIVGQGQLDKVLHATPEDRRGFIEEAAGILKHRQRGRRRRSGSWRRCRQTCSA